MALRALMMMAEVVVDRVWTSTYERSSPPRADTSCHPSQRDQMLPFPMGVGEGVYR